MSPDGNYVFVAGANSDSVAVVDVTIKTTPVVKGGVTSATYMDYAYGVAVSPDGKYVFVTGAYSDSVAVVDVIAKEGYTTHTVPTAITHYTTQPFCVEA